MPTYVYTCPNCGQIEDKASIFAPARTTCPQCEVPVTKTYGSVSFVLRGQGFARTSTGKKGLS